MVLKYRSSTLYQLSENTDRRKIRRENVWKVGIRDSGVLTDLMVLLQLSSYDLKTAFERDADIKSMEISIMAISERTIFSIAVTLSEARGQLEGSERKGSNWR